MSPVDATTPPLPRWRELLWVPLVLLGTVWVLVVPVPTAQALFSTVTFLGERPTAADHLVQHHGFGRALLVSAALVAAGFALAVLGCSARGGWVFTLLVLPTVVLALLWLGTTPHETQTPSAPAPRSPAACQELSGGGTRCPGG